MGLNGVERGDLEIAAFSLLQTTAAISGANFDSVSCSRTISHRVCRDSEPNCHYDFWGPVCQS